MRVAHPVALRGVPITSSNRTEGADAILSRRHAPGLRRWDGVPSHGSIAKQETECRAPVGRARFAPMSIGCRKGNDHEGPHQRSRNGSSCRPNGIRAGLAASRATGRGRLVRVLGRDHRRVLPSVVRRAGRPENVRFHATPAAAERAGFRACKRCKPDQPPLAERQAAQVAALCRMIETADQVPTLDELAAARRAERVSTPTGCSRRSPGVTPRAYAAAHRARRVRGELRTRATVTEAIYGAGYNSSAGSTRRRTPMLGMTPTAYRAGGAGAEIRFADRRVLARGRSWSRRPSAACAPSCSATIPRRCSAICRTGSRAPDWSAATRRSSGWSRKVVGFVEAPGARPRPAARHPRHRVPAAGLAGPARRSPPARPRATPTSPAGSARRARCGRWRRRARPTRWRWRSRATGWSAPTAPVGLPLGRRAQARAAGARSAARCLREPPR